MIAIHDWDGPVTPSFQRTWSSEPLELVWSTDSPVPAQATPIEIALWGDMDGSLNCAMLASPQTAALAYLVGQPSGSPWGWGSVAAPHAETIGPVAGINAGAPLTELIVTLWAGNLQLMLYGRGVNPPVGLPIVGWPAPASGSGAALAYFANRWYVFYIAADGSLNVVASSDVSNGADRRRYPMWSAPRPTHSVSAVPRRPYSPAGPRSWSSVPACRRRPSHASTAQRIGRSGPTPSIR